jgi:PqqD family protein of HPr-rel-A system
MKWQRNTVGQFYDPHESTVVYFDTLCGDTHLLSDFAAYLLQQFGSQPVTTEELVHKVSPSIDAGDISELRETVSGVLEELVALDILKRA